MQTKIYKPTSCLACKVCKKEGNKVFCTCARNDKVSITDSVGLKKMYDECPLDWDK